MIPFHMSHNKYTHCENAFEQNLPLQDLLQFRFEDATNQAIQMQNHIVFIPWSS